MQASQLQEKCQQLEEQVVQMANERAAEAERHWLQIKDLQEALQSEKDQSQGLRIQLGAAESQLVQVWKSMCSLPVACIVYGVAASYYDATSGICVAKGSNRSLRTECVARPVTASNYRD